jgi:hypothetical protein
MICQSKRSGQSAGPARGSGRLVTVQTELAATAPENDHAASELRLAAERSSGCRRRDTSRSVAPHGSTTADRIQRCGRNRHHVYGTLSTAYRRCISATVGDRCREPEGPAVLQQSVARPTWCPYFHRGAAIIVVCRRTSGGQFKRELL